MCGVFCASHENTTRDLSPSDRCLICSVCAGPVTPNRPIMARTFSMPPESGNSRDMYSSGVISGSSRSVRCWWYMPMRRWLWRLTMPSTGSSCPVIRLSSVDLPVFFCFFFLAGVGVERGVLSLGGGFACACA